MLNICPSSLGEEREAIIAEAKRAAAEAKLLAAERKEKEYMKQSLMERSYRHHKLEEEDRYSRYHEKEQQMYNRIDKSAQTDQGNQKKIVLRRYDGRRYTADELNQAVKHAYKAVDKAYRDLRTLF